MDDVELFLAHAIQLERDAARRFEDLMHSMVTAGNREVENLFRRLGEFSRIHLKEAMARGGFRTLPELAPGEFRWPDGVTPEAAGWLGVDSNLDVLAALQVALAGERSGWAYYEAIARDTKDPEVARMAALFAREEAQHVSELERWVARFVSPSAGEVDSKAKASSPIRYQ
jgi:rubrerythrin